MQFHLYSVTQKLTYFFTYIYSFYCESEYLFAFSLRVLTAAKETVMDILSGNLTLMP